MAVILTSTNRQLSLPGEICGLIVQFVQPLSRSDLRNFCRVSQGFRSEAERYLYINVLLHGLRATKLWARAVHSRPYLSAKTKQVVFYLPKQTDLEADDLGWMVKGLRTCTALEDLRVLEELDDHSPEGKRDHYGNSVNRWILYDHPFKLKSFTNEYFQNHLLNDFLRSQPNLQSLCLKGDDEAVLQLDDIPLTKLHTIDGTPGAMLAFLLDDNFERKMQHLQVEFRVFHRSSLSFWRHLPAYANTIQSVSIIETGDSKWGHAFHSYIVHVCEHLPKLRYLRVLSTKVYPQGCETWSLGWEFMIPTNLTHLEAIVLRPPTMSPTDEELDQGRLGRCAYDAFRNPAARRVSALGVMRLMASLQRVDIGIGNELHRFSKMEHGFAELSVPIQDGYDRHDFDWRNV